MGPLKMHEKSHLTNLTPEVMLLTSGESNARDVALTYHHLFITVWDRFSECSTF
jgi:hypothetical protein